MALFVYAGMVKYSGFAAAGEEANKFLEQMPLSARKLFGMAELDITSISAFYSIFSLYFFLLLGLHAVMLGAVILSKEERDRTADFLFVKPLLRSRILTAKLVAALFNIAGFNLVTMISSIFIVNSFNKGEPIHGQIIRLCIALFFVQVLYLALGALVAALSNNTKKASSLAAFLLLFHFMLSVLIDLYEKLDKLTILTPFKYFDALQLMKEGKFEPIYMILVVAGIIAATVGTYLLYNKRDLKI